MTKVTLFLMNYKGFTVLKDIINNKKNDLIDKIISSRDPNVENDYYDDIRNICGSTSIPFYDKNDKFDLCSDYIISIGWRWIIRSNIKIIVLHDSLLPKYRGFAPLVSCLLNKEKSIGVTAIFAADDYDTGEIILQKKLIVKYPIKIKDAIEKVSTLYSDVVISILNIVKNGQILKSKKQNEKKATYSLWRDEEDYRIDWSKSASELNRFIDAVDFPYLGASSIIDKEKIRIYDSEILTDVKIENRMPGKVIFIQEGCPVVVCGRGLLKLNKIVTDKTKESLIPFKKFRIRFK